MSGLTLADVFDLLGSGELENMFVGGHDASPDADKQIRPLALDDAAYYRQKDTGSPFDETVTAGQTPTGFNGVITAGNPNGQVIAGALDDGAGAGTGIRQADRARLAGHVELGLRALYSRFLFAEDTLSLDIYTGRSLYALRAPSGQGDILKIDAVHVHDGRELVLNDRFDPMSVRTPRFDRLMFPECLLYWLMPCVGGHAHEAAELMQQRVTVTYRALHPRIDPYAATDSPEAVAIELPQPYLQALLFFVASRIMNPVGMVEEFHAGNTYAAKYEQECQLLESKNLDVDDMSQRDRFNQQGFC